MYSLVEVGILVAIIAAAVLTPKLIALLVQGINPARLKEIAMRGRNFLNPRD